MRIHTTPFTEAPTLTEGCRITVVQFVTSGAGSEEKSYDIEDSFEGRFYTGRDLGPIATGWNIRDLEESSELSAEHCALTKFDIETDTCTLVNVSTSRPVLVKPPENFEEVRFERGDRKVFVVGTETFSLHLRR